MPSIGLLFCSRASLPPARFTGWRSWAAKVCRWQVPGLVLALSVLSGVAAIVAAHRNPATSLIDLESMKLKTYSLSVYGASAFRIAVSVLPFLLPLMFQISFGLNAFQSGLYLLALFAGDLSMKAFVIQALRRFGFRRILIVNGIITAASMALCALLSPATATILVIAILFFHGAGPIDGVHLPDNAGLHRDSIRQDEPGQRFPQRGDATQHGDGRGHRSHHPAPGRPRARPFRSRSPTARFPPRHPVHRGAGLGPVFDSLGLPPDAAPPPAAIASRSSKSIPSERRTWQNMECSLPKSSSNQRY